MKRSLKITLVFFGFFLMAVTANAGHIGLAGVRYEAVDAQEFVYGEGGPEGGSGAYITISIGVADRSAIANVRAKAEHGATGFEVTLTERDLCTGILPPEYGVDQFFYTRLRPEGWMTGEWKLKLEYEEGEMPYIEEATVVVPRFNFPPIPTGIEISERNGQRVLVWNRIGNPWVKDPGTGRFVTYRVRHYKPSTWCVDQTLSPPFEVWSGNRIAVPLPPNWESGDMIRIENQVVDDSLPGGVTRWDRAMKILILPVCP